MVAGRPPKLFSKEQAEELGKDLLEWINTHGKNQLNWVEWYYNKHNMFRNDWRALLQRSEFLTYYEVARKIMASNMMQNKDFHHSYGHRYLALYDDELLEHELSVKEHEAKLKNTDANHITAEDWEKFLKVQGYLNEKEQTSENNIAGVDHNC